MSGNTVRHRKWKIKGPTKPHKNTFYLCETHTKKAKEYVAHLAYDWLILEDFFFIVIFIYSLHNSLLWMIAQT